MQKSKRIKAFSELGNNLESFVKSFKNLSEDASTEKFKDVLTLAKARNGWFTIENQLYAISSWVNALQQDKLEKWLDSYDIKDDNKIQKVGVVAAGNIPMVGFHDIMSILMSGHKALIKLSSSDNVLIPYILDLLTEIEPAFKDRFEIVDQLKGFDAVIATGSDNTARYFESYFKDVPHIIRKNRTSIAVLEGNENEEQLKNLTQDILLHFGLGCRNVTKLFVPRGYDLDKLFKVLFSWSEVINHHKYANNYDYNKAIYLMKGLDFVENGFVLVKKDDGLFSPISSIYYQEYDDMKEIENFIKDHEQEIQCTVGNQGDMIPFGKTQEPELWDYADHIDTMHWLLNL